MGGERKPGWWIPWTFVAFFLVVVAANATMIWVGYRSWTGLVTENYYEEGIHYNRTLEAVAAQKKLGWQADLAAALDGGFRGHVELRVVDRAGAPVEGGEASVRFARPTHEGSDFVVRLRDRGDGVYTASFQLPEVGQWDLYGRIRRGEDHFAVHRRVMLR